MNNPLTARSIWQRCSHPEAGWADATAIAQYYGLKLKSETPDTEPTTELPTVIRKLAGGERLLLLCQQRWFQSRRRLAEAEGRNLLSGRERLSHGGLINIERRLYYLTPENGNDWLPDHQIKKVHFPSEHWLHDSFWLGNINGNRHYFHDDGHARPDWHHWRRALFLPDRWLHDPQQVGLLLEQLVFCFLQRKSLPEYLALHR